GLTAFLRVTLGSSRLARAKLSSPRLPLDDVPFRIGHETASLSISCWSVEIRLSWCAVECSMIASRTAACWPAPRALPQGDVRDVWVREGVKEAPSAGHSSQPLSWLVIFDTRNELKGGR